MSHMKYHMTFDAVFLNKVLHFFSSFSNDFHIGWDGRLKSGKPAPVDVYIYKIFLTGESGKEIEKMGTVTLIR